ncbi:hypothetical protein CRENBAI_000673 [Crenichthys baileyi]|uniref:Uncharacterized protein n=1 Tax=Crenichthys baileyi TaxID=28760 RepID=A0AAV9QVG7_9TELE
MIHQGVRLSSLGMMFWSALRPAGAESVYPGRATLEGGQGLLGPGDRICRLSAGTDPRQRLRFNSDCGPLTGLVTWSVTKPRSNPPADEGMRNTCCCFGCQAPSGGGKLAAGKTKSQTLTPPLPQRPPPGGPE